MVTGLGGRFLTGSSTTTRGLTIARPRLYELGAALWVGRRRAFRTLVAASGVQRGDRVLDVGCGTGYFARQVALAVGPAGRVLGVDASPPMIAYAVRAARRLPWCRFEVGLAESLPLESASVDVAVSSLVIHHLPPDLRPTALAEMQRVLRPGGRLLIADFQPPTGRVGGALTRVLTSHAMQHHDVDDLQLLITATGFAVHETTPTRGCATSLRLARDQSPVGLGRGSGAPASIANGWCRGSATPSARATPAP